MPVPGQQVPGKDDRHHYAEAERRTKPPKTPPPLVAQRDENERNGDDHGRDEALREHAGAERGVHAGEPRRPPPSGDDGATPAPEGHDHGGRHQHVGPERACLEHEADARHERHTGDDAGFLPVEQRTEAARREEGDGAGRHRHETRPLARPQDVKDERREPVDERRLVQEQGEVEMGSRVVAEDHHLARDLGVPSLVVEERRQLQAERDEHARRQRERDRPSSHAGGAGADGGYEGRPIRYRLRTRLHGGSLCDRPAKVNASRACATLPRPLNMPVI